jgi:transposase IS4-like protein
MTAHRASAVPADARFPLRLIQEAVDGAGVRERRRRLLPAAGVMVFVLGCCLFSGDAYGEVARKLAGWLGPLAGRPAWPVPGSSALARARRRLGERPFELLFGRLAGPLAGPGTPGAVAFGRVLVAIDGTSLEVPYTPANVAAFGSPPSGRAAGCGFPRVELVTVTGCGTRALAGAALGPRRGAGCSEQELARQLAGAGVLGPGMLVLADRGFCGYPVVSALGRVESSV